MSDSDAVLFANEAFYAAFGGRDFAAMRELWTRRRPVSCIHPGWPALHGHDEVMKSWEGILSNPASPRLRCRFARAYVHGEAAYVLCYEFLDGGSLAATNVFVREDGTWRLVHHQASAAPLPESATEQDEPPPRLQ